MAKTVTGIVSSDKGNKTIVVMARTRKTHPLYRKQYTETKKVMAHDEKNEAKLGDKVLISESRPLSARKHYTLTKIIERATVQHEEAVETERSRATKKKVDVDQDEAQQTAGDDE